MATASYGVAITTAVERQWLRPDSIRPGQRCQVLIIQVPGGEVVVPNLPDGTEGLVVTKVDGTSEAFTKGLREGDLITEAGQQKVSRIEDLKDRLTEAKDAGRKSILLLVRRGGDPRFVALSIEG